MEVTGCATAAVISPCAPARNPCDRSQVLAAFGLQDSRITEQHFKTKANPNPNTMCLLSTLGEDPGSGHFYLAKNRTFLLCVDTSCTRSSGLVTLSGFELCPLASDELLWSLVSERLGLADDPNRSNRWTGQ